MNNQEAIEAIRSNYPTSGYEMLKEALNMAVNALEQQEKERWHVVADGDLPKESGSYIVTTKNLTGYSPIKDNVFECTLYGNDFTFQRWEDNKVIAWKELPEEYKPEEGK